MDEGMREDEAGNDQPEETPATPEPADEAPGTDGDEPVTGSAAAAEDETEEANEGRGRRAPRILRPVDALEALERQWVSRVPPGEWRGDIVVLAPTIPADALGYPYLEAITGSDAAAANAARAALLYAQLAADALVARAAVRPRVELLPLGRSWYVVRTVAEYIVAVDGPGFPTPLKAVRAAFLRYSARLEAQREGPSDEPADVA